MNTRWAMALLSLTLAGDATGGLPFIEDDYPRAIAQGAKQHLPVFVEVSAPW